MKFILYITLLSILQSLSSGDDDYYKILQNPYDLGLLEDEDFIYVYDDSISATQFIESKPITIPAEKVFSEHNFTLSSPFILSTEVKIDEPACLFTITDNKIVKLSLCFTLANVDVIKIMFEGNALPEQVDLIYKGDIKEWTKIMLHVDDRNVTLYEDCQKITSLEFSVSVKDTYFSENAILNLGHYGDGLRFFKGTVRDIKLYTYADADYVKKICAANDVSIFPSSNDSGDPDNDPPPENLTTFTQGEKGEKGDKGDSGPSGPEGPQGPPGSPGLKGEEGTCSCSASVVSNLLRSMPEMRLPPGERGPKGDFGDPGPMGLTGKQGNPGPRGDPGLKGETGERGDAGSPGKDGLPGSKGEPGRQGDPGPPGIIGPQGPPGPPGAVVVQTDKTKPVNVPGEKGDQGPIGSPGVPGQRGIQGEKGEKGQRGDKGEKGDKGHNGLEGPRGEKGETGEAGKDGIPGNHGTHGRPGDKGDRGDRGDKGEPGLPGLPAKLTSLLDPKMDPHENAAIVKKLRGDKGETGKSGEKGERGDAGPMGPPGHHVKGPRGDKGPMGPRGFKGEPGEPGLSKNISLNDDTLVKLKGEKGDRGNDGKPGEPGNPGLPGSCSDSCKAHVVSGPPGPPGPPGRPGVSVTGPKGEPGGILSQSTYYSFSDGPNESHGNMDDDDDFYTAMTVVFRTTNALIKHTSSTPLGTLAYVLREKMLLMRVQNGWQYVVMGSLIETRHVSLSTTLKPLPSRIQEKMPAKREPTDQIIRLIALNEPYSGNMMNFNHKIGRSAVDHACLTEARRYGLEGTFTAFLANNIEDLRSVVKHKQDLTLPVVNIRGEQLFRSWLEMFNGSGAIFAKPANIYSFNGKNIFIDSTWPIKAVWHGADVRGIRYPKAFCNEWQSNYPQNFGVASSLSHYRLLGQDKYSCDNKLIVLCVDVVASKRRQRHLVSRSRARTSRSYAKKAFRSL